MSDSFSLKAGGTIRPSRFITISDSYEVLESNAGDLTFGVSHDSTKAAPADGLASPNHAEAGDHVSYYKLGDSCLLAISEDVAAGTLLGPNADGEGTATIAAGAVAGAIALEASTAGTGSTTELIRVQLVQIREHA